MQFAYGEEKLPKPMKSLHYKCKLKSTKRNLAAGLEKLLSSCPGQANFLATQVTYNVTLPNGQGLRYVIGQLN